MLVTEKEVGIANNMHNSLGIYTRLILGCRKKRSLWGKVYQDIICIGRKMQVTVGAGGIKTNMNCRWMYNSLGTRLVLRLWKEEIFVGKVCQDIVCIGKNVSYCRCWRD